MQPKKYRVSIVNYTNTLPFKWALKRSSILEKIELQEDIPSICAQKLKYRQVELALVPVALLGELDEYYIETDFCIGANGKVDTVKLYSQVPVEQIRSVKLDYQSRTSIQLARVLFKFHWKKEADFIDARPGFEKEINATEAAVVIGDRTFALNGKFAYEYDLSEMWKEFTGLPFVFAAWVAWEKLPGDFINDFNSTLRFGLDNIARAVNEEEEKPIGEKEILHYLRERIDYRLDEEKLKALRLFLGYTKQL